MRTMTIAEFRETRKYHIDLGRAVSDRSLNDVAGWSYADEYYIIGKSDALDAELLILGNGQWVGELQDLEVRLYDFAVSDGNLVVKAPKTATTRYDRCRCWTTIVFGQGYRVLELTRAEFVEWEIAAEVFDNGDGEAQVAGWKTESYGMGRVDEDEFGDVRGFVERMVRHG